MGFLDVNLEDLETEFRPHQSGPAQLQIDDLSLETSAHKGTLHLNVKLNVLEVNGDAPTHNSPVWEQFYLNEKSLWKLANLFRALKKTYRMKGDLDKQEDRDKFEEDMRELLLGSRFSDRLITRVYDPSDETTVNIRGQIDDAQMRELLDEGKQVRSVLSGRYRAVL
jgi:hypothetical protein